MIHARIGLANRVHVLQNCYDMGGWYWGSSICTPWAGRAYLTSDPVTCWACREKAKTPLKSLHLTPQKPPTA